MALSGELLVYSSVRAGGAGGGCWVTVCDRGGRVMG